MKTMDSCKYLISLLFSSFVLAILIAFTNENHFVRLLLLIRNFKFKNHKFEAAEMYLEKFISFNIITETRNLGNKQNETKKM